MGFRKVLIANRGEIAVRITRTLHEMGIAAVAVYSEADREALHVRRADEAYPIGPAPAAESYLRVDKIVAVAKQSGCAAIAPGYGFLSENPALPEACERAGIVFIGPPASAMRAMGTKTAARKRMAEAGVPITPGATCETADEAAAAARKLGFPVMLKAASGGGGKGIRLVTSEAEMASAWERARSEAKKSFGDDTVYLEKAIERPRHVEIQVLGDREGNCVHVFERDCSIQRRNQKVVEETPSPAAPPELVAKMGAIAVQGAKAVGYHSAGTFEFLLAPDGSFYFLEMNTRLQVEHPITELVTGLDLVREMILVAQGEKLSFGQSDVTRRGAAVECRIYAEDPIERVLALTGRHPPPRGAERARRARRRRRVRGREHLELLRPAHLEAVHVGSHARARPRAHAPRPLRVRGDGHSHEHRVPPEAPRSSRLRFRPLRHRLPRAKPRLFPRLRERPGRPAHPPRGRRGDCGLAARAGDGRAERRSERVADAPLPLGRGKPNPAIVGK